MTSAFSGLTINRGNGEDGSGSVTLTIGEGLLWAVGRALETCGKRYGNTAQESLGYYLRDALTVIRGEANLDDFPLLKKVVTNVAPLVEDVTIEDREPAPAPVKSKRKSRKAEVSLVE